MTELKQCYSFSINTLILSEKLVYYNLRPAIHTRRTIGKYKIIW